MATTYHGWTRRGGKPPRARPVVATPEAMLNALKKAKAELPEGAPVSIDRLIQSAQKYCAVNNEYYRAHIRRLTSEIRAELGLPPKRKSTYGRS